MTDVLRYYEQPLNEPIRLCLRLEHLFLQADHSLGGSTPCDARLCLQAVLEILSVMDRPDLKTKLVTALTAHAKRLTQLEANPEVDNHKLEQLLNQLDSLIDQLHGDSKKMAASLRADPFLSTVRQFSANPGGACNFSVPRYQCWLTQPANHRRATLDHWLATLRPLRAAMTLLLQLTRAQAMQKNVLAKQGFYQAALDPAQQLQMIRVCLGSPNENMTPMPVYPEISIGRHRLSIYFYQLGQLSGDPAIKVTTDLPFTLIYCLF